MPARILYLAAYDVTDPDRLHAALRVLKGYACGGPNGNGGNWWPRCGRCWT